MHNVISKTFGTCSNYSSPPPMHDVYESELVPIFPIPIANSILVLAPHILFLLWLVGLGGGLLA